MTSPGDLVSWSSPGGLPVEGQALRWRRRGEVAWRSGTWHCVRVWLGIEPAIKVCSSEGTYADVFPTLGDVWEGRAEGDDDPVK